jgi:ubiquinol-cytochrome c reductase cytochrome b subunit/menaquinol-cytochrome c reductase cytochrome b/c subunit
VNQAEKEQYLREYEVLKKKGKPFFPYAITKDSAMMLIVFLVIATMAIVLGAEQGPKADPTTTTYVPRPEWYFFFLFEVLRVIKPPELVPIATIIIPTVCMVLLLLLPFYDRGPERRPERRPIAMTALVLTVIAMALLTYEGANTGSTNEIALAIPGVQGGTPETAAAAAAGNENLPPDKADLVAGRQVVAQSGCLACHKLGENGNAGPGPALTDIGARIPRSSILRSMRAGPDIMPSFNDLPKKKLNALADYLASLN